MVIKREDKERYIEEVIEGFNRKGRIDYDEVDSGLREDVRVEEIIEEERRLRDVYILEQLRQSIKEKVSSMNQMKKDIS